MCFPSARAEQILICKCKQTTSEGKLPCKHRPVCVKVITSGRHVKLDLVELIEVVDYVASKVGLEEGATGIIPVTAWRENERLITHQLTALDCN